MISCTHGKQFCCALCGPNDFKERPEPSHSCAGLRGRRSDFWRHIAWCVGDKHANRICVLVDLYCWAFKAKPERLWFSR